MPSKKATPKSRTASKAVSTHRSSRAKTSSRRPTLRARFTNWLNTISPSSILVVGFCVVSISIIHTLFVDISDWYWSLPQPEIQATAWFFEFGLTGVFALLTASIVILWNIPRPGRIFLMWLFVLAGMLHIMWNMFFFGLHLVEVSFVDGIALMVLMLAIIMLAWRRSKPAALLLIPYLWWVMFILFFNGWILTHSL